MMMLSPQARRVVSLVCCVLLIALCGGCGGPPVKQVAPATGTLKLDGAPLTGFTVYFASAAGDVASGVTDTEGRFTLKTGDRSGAPVGECKAYVQEPVERAEITAEQMKSEDVYKLQHSRRSKPRDPEKKKLNFPAKYTSPEKSGLTFPVAPEADKNVFDLNLTSK